MSRVAELEEALRWYACPDHWTSPDGGHETVLLAEESGWIKATVALLQPQPPPRRESAETVKESLRRELTRIMKGHTGDVLLELLLSAAVAVIRELFQREQWPDLCKTFALSLHGYVQQPPSERGTIQ